MFGFNCICVWFYLYLCLVLHVFVFGFAFLVCICKRSRGMVVTESGRFFLHVLVIDEHLKHVKGGVASLSVHLYTFNVHDNTMLRHTLSYI